MKNLASEDFTAALASLALFPLPGITLFPGESLRLHIFEPRYRKMIRDVIDSHGVFCVVQIVDAEPAKPTIARVGGAALLTEWVELSGGRFNIVVCGLARLELEELPIAGAYRTARARMIASPIESVASADRTALTSTVTSFVTLLRKRDSRFEFRFPGDSDAGALADHCAAELLIDGRDRQRVLEAPSAAERVQIVTEAIALQRLAMASEAGLPN